ncbi:tetratricopeptide repeat protein [uncultured Flavobacterium sp.]|uniref:tetratricopeptide repeat protein n=1 Tax=uncultured Flavobacterium sp. TaxID=165435 RepID=UPI0025D820D7|nr:tetratricopeptide repeat protein [uncultured Flavobacterium sp.]
MLKRLSLLILLFVSVSHYGQSYDFKKAELDARKFIYSKPDSALVIIKKTLSHKGAHDTVYGNTYNIYGMYFGMKGNSDSLIHYTRKSLNYLGNYPRNKARSLMNMSIGYRNKADYKSAIKYIEQALALHEKDNNNVGVAMAYGELASNHNYMLDYDRSIDLLLKAIKILKAEKNTKQLVAIKQKLANTYLAKENFKFAIDLYRECLAEFKQGGMTKNYYMTQLNLGEALIQVNDLRGAKKALDEAVRGLEPFSDKEMLGICHSKIGNLENTLGNYDKAIASFQRAMDYLKFSESNRIVRIAGEYINLLNEGKNYKKSLEVIALTDKLERFDSANIQDKMVYKNAVADTYKATNNEKEAIKAYQHTIAIMDSIADSEKKSAVDEIQAKFQTELQREKNLGLEANNRVLQATMKSEQNLMLLYMLVSIAIIIFILLALRGYWLKSKLQKEELKSVEAEKNMIKQQHKYEQELTNTQKDTIEEKQRELTSTTLRMANYQDSINQIIDKCESNSYAKVGDVKKELQNLVKQKDYWRQFETRFNSLHPEFSTTLSVRFPKLTKNDIEFCSLLKLNLSNKEIASLLQISHESAITKKYRIKKKMDIHDDEDFEKMLTEV